MKVVEKDISVQAIACHGAPVSKTFSSSDTGNADARPRGLSATGLRAVPLRNLGGVVFHNK